MFYISAYEMCVVFFSSVSFKCFVHVSELNGFCLLVVKKQICFFFLFFFYWCSCLFRNRLPSAEQWIEKMREFGPILIEWKIVFLRHTYSWTQKKYIRGWVGNNVQCNTWRFTRSQCTTIVSIRLCAFDARKNVSFKCDSLPNENESAHCACYAIWVIFK